MQILLIISIMIAFQGLPARHSLVGGGAFPTKQDSTKNIDTIPVILEKPFREEQVSFDSKGNLMEITQEEASRLGIFKDVEGFFKASVYKTSPAEYTIEIRYQEDNKIYKNDSTLSEPDFMALRLQIDNLILVEPKVIPQLKLDRSGWGFFLLGQFQVAFSEWAPLTTALLPDNVGGETAGATYLLTAAGGFFVPLYLTYNQPITLGQASLSYSWAHQGYYTGFVLSDLLNFSDYFELNRIHSATMLAGSILGAWTGYSFAGEQNLTPGRADLTAWFGYWGGGYAGLTAVLLIPWENSSWESIRWKWKVYETSALLGMGYGSYLWYKKAPDIYSYGDALSYRIFTAMSALTSLNIITYFPWESTDNEWVAKLYIAIGMGINAIGMREGLKLFTTTDLSLVDAGALFGGTLAGGLVGSALVVLAQPDWKVGFSMVLAGGWLGYGITYNLIKEGQGSEGNSWLQLYPENLAALWLGKSRNQQVSASLVTFSF